MIAGRLTAKRGFWHVVLELKHDSGKRYSKWISTGLKTTGTKKQAETILFQKRLEYTKISQIQERSNGVLFDVYMEVWLNGRKTEISSSTYLSYYYIVKGIIEYFRIQKVLLSELKPYHITEFYRTLYAQGLSGHAVLHYHTIIRRALETAVVNDLIIVNPASKVERPKKGEYIVRPYSDEETQRLIEAIAGEKLELTVLIALYTGLRRSEILGLKWKSINFKDDLIFINHSVKYAMENGKRVVVGADSLKGKSSYRTLPLSQTLKKHLLLEKERRYKSHPIKLEDYICGDENGTVLKPDYVSKEFKKILLKKNLRVIRFHDLRHSCANLLIRQRVPLIEVQQWMGHSKLSTTADMYIHLTFETKLRCSNVIDSILSNDKSIAQNFNTDTVYENELDDAHKGALVEKPFPKTILRKLYLLIFVIFSGSYNMNQTKPQPYPPNGNIYHVNSVSADHNRYAQVKLQKRIRIPMKT